MGQQDKERAAVQQAEPVKVKRYFVAEGHAIQCQRGHLTEGAEVFPDKDGIGRFKEFVEKGYLVEK